MNQIKQMLELMDRPAFCAEQGRITAVNKAAEARQVLPGTAVAELLTSGQEDYADFSGGCLCLSLRVCGEDYLATVTALENTHVFSLDQEGPERELRMLSLAAMELREPLNAVMSLVDELPGTVEADQLARINRGLHQLLRIVGNMSGHPVPRFEMMDLNELLQEIWDGALPACESRGLKLRFVPHRVPVYSCVDAELLTRAVHNLLSNAIKFSRPDSEIELRLSLSMRSYQIIVCNTTDLPTPLSEPFTRYRRMPGIEDGRCGLGLGLMLVRSAAVAHGGTALLDQPAPNSVRVSLRLPRRQNTSELRSTLHSISYSGERSPLLIELSDVLPPEFYQI